MTNHLWSHKNCDVKWVVLCHHHFEMKNLFTEKMKLLLGLSLLSPSPKPLELSAPRQLQKVELPTICTEHFECEFPYRCCNGIFFNYCCTDGHGSRIPKSRFPNITFPELPDDFPFPVPRPYPVPVPIPISVPVQ